MLIKINRREDVSAKTDKPYWLISTMNVAMTDYTYSEPFSEFSGLESDFGCTPIFKQIEKNAKSYPHRPAIFFDEDIYSYQWLNASANRLAHFLIEKGISSGNRLVVCIEPSPYILVAIFALHKIGAVYVPLDPTFPAARLAVMLDEVDPQGLLTYCPTVATSIDYPGDVSFDFAAFDQTCSTYSEENPDLAIEAHMDAYVFFTSGTTGKPKGVLATHGNLIHYLSSAKEIYRFSAQDKFLAAAKFTFSISLFELILPLFVGASVRIVRRDDVLNMEKMAKFFEAVSVFHIGPGLLKKLLPFIRQTYQDFSVYQGMRHVSSGGDHVPVDVLELMKLIFANAEVYVIYGSTEVSCMGSTFRVPREQVLEKTFVGLPHRNTRVRVEDEAGQLVPRGEVGDILFSGPGVVKGYLNLPEVTAEKFVDRDGERFYQIGDVGSMNDQGLLALSGRKDFQVQFHGIRIELLEIEAVLKKYELIEDCVVAGVVEDGGEEISLVAYMVFKHPNEVKLQQIIHFLRRQLPEYMVPSKYIGLPSLPLNHNGKLDRAQLPKPTIDNILVSNEFVAAENATEQALIELWENLFKLTGIGVTHDFFELGGDSLLAVQFLGEVDALFGRFIPITTLLTYTTLRDIAQIIDGDVSVPEMQNVNVLRHGDRSLPALFCLYGVLLYQDLANALAIPNIVCGVYLQEEVDLIYRGIDSEEFQAFTKVSTIAEKYYQSITEYQPKGPYFICGESFGGIIALEVAKLLEANGKEVKLIAMFDTLAPGFLSNLSKRDKFAIHAKQFAKYGFEHVKNYVIPKLAPARTRLMRLLGRVDKNSEVQEDIRGLVREIASSGYFPARTDHAIVLFKASERSPFEPDSDDLGWANYVREVDHRQIQGTHIGILSENNVGAIAQVLEPYFVER